MLGLLAVWMETWPPLLQMLLAGFCDEQTWQVIQVINDLENRFILLSQKNPGVSLGSVSNVFRFLYFLDPLDRRPVCSDLLWSGNDVCRSAVLPSGHRGRPLVSPSVSRGPLLFTVFCTHRDLHTHSQASHFRNTQMLKFTLLCRHTHLTCTHIQLSMCREV